MTRQALPYRKFILAIAGVALCGALLQARADGRLVSALSITLVSSEPVAFMRISCMGGESLFISVEFPAGSLNPDALRVPGATGADTRWITSGDTGRSVNIVYSAMPRALLRRLAAGKPVKYVFTAGQYAFDTRGLQGWQRNLPAACR